MDLENILNELRNEIINGLDTKSQKIYENLKFVNFELNENTKLSYLYRNEQLIIKINKLELQEFPKFLKIDLEFFQFFVDHLDYLDLHSNQISSIPQWISQFKNLSFLSLIGNKLKDFYIPIIPNLKCLVLSGNKIQKCNVNLDNFPNLLLLDLRINKINQIEIVCSSDHSLETLMLSSNKLESFPKTLEMLKNLKYLFLDYNPLERLDIDFSKLKNLKSIHIDKRQKRLLTDQQLFDLKENNCIIKII